MNYIRKVLEKKNILRNEEMAASVAHGLEKQLNNMRLPMVTTCMAVFYVWCNIKETYPEIAAELERAYALSKEPTKEE